MFVYYKTDFNKKFFNKNFESVDLNKSILIYPTKRKVREINKQIIKNSQNKSISNVDIYTLGTFFEKLFLADNFDKKLLTSSIQFVILRNVCEISDLNYFSQKGKYISKSLIELFSQIITRYKELGLFEKEILLNQENFDQKSNRLKNQDIFNVFSLYQKKLVENKLYEIGDVYRYLTQLTDEQFIILIKKTITDKVNFVFNGFSEFTEPELKLIWKFFQSESFNPIITLDFVFENAELFSNQIVLDEKLKKIGFKCNEIDNEIDAIFLNSVRNNLFNSHSHLLTHSPSHPLTLTQIEANDIQEEVESIARFIKIKIHKDKLFRPEDIAVLVNNIDDYSDIIRDVFTSYGIPINLTDRFDLQRSLGIIILINLLRLIANDFYSNDLISIIRSYFFEKFFINRIAVIEFIHNSGVISNKQNYLDALKSKIDYFENVGENDEDNYKGQKLKIYKDIYYDLTNFFDLFNFSKTKKYKPKDFICLFTELMQRLSILDYFFKFPSRVISQQEKILLKAKEIGALSGLLKILEELSELNTILDTQKEEHNLSYFIEYLENAIIGKRYSLSYKLSGGILITTPNELRGINYPLVIVCSMNNGDFPKKYSSLFYFEENYQDEQKKKLFNERYLFFEVLKCFENELVLTSKKSNNKKNIHKSDFIKELNGLFQVNSFAKDEISDIFNFNELYKKCPETLINIRHKIKTYIIRKQNSEEGIFTGYIFADEMLKKMEDKVKQKIFSASQIRKYMNCPFNYFVNYLLEIKEIKDLEEDIQAYEYGTIFHNILKEFFEYLKSNNIDFYAGLNDAAQHDFFYNKLIEISTKLIEKKYLFNEYKFSFYNYLFDGNGQLKVLKTFLEYEKGNNRKIKPYLFEYDFNEILKISNNKELKIKGSIDRIDYSENNAQLLLLDYKTGKINSDIIDIQVPLYLYILTKIFGRQKIIIQNIDCGWLKINKERRNINIKFESAIKKFEINSLEEYILNNLNTFYNDITSGKFKINGEDEIDKGICRPCNLKSICRKEYFELG